MLEGLTQSTADMGIYFFFFFLYLAVAHENTKYAVFFHLNTTISMVMEKNSCNNSPIFVTLYKNENVRLGQICWQIQYSVFYFV